VNWREEEKEGKENQARGMRKDGRESKRPTGIRFLVDKEEVELGFIH